MIQIEYSTLEYSKKTILIQTYVYSSIIQSFGAWFNSIQWMATAKPRSNEYSLVVCHDCVNLDDLYAYSVNKKKVRKRYAQKTCKFWACVNRLFAISACTHSHLSWSTCSSHCHTWFYQLNSKFSEMISSSLIPVCCEIYTMYLFHFVQFIMQTCVSINSTCQQQLRDRNLVNVLLKLQSDSLVPYFLF